jgi:hypothetical protein
VLAVPLRGVRLDLLPRDSRASIWISRCSTESSKSIAAHAHEEQVELKVDVGPRLLPREIAYARGREHVLVDEEVAGERTAVAREDHSRSTSHDRRLARPAGDVVAEDPLDRCCRDRRLRPERLFTAMPDSCNSARPS